MHNFKPQDCLTMSGQPAPAEDDATYSLVAVIRHSGGTDGGHYVTYALDTVAEQWYLYDDAAVIRVRPALGLHRPVWAASQPSHLTRLFVQVSPEEVHQTQAYVLFYR